MERTECPNCGSPMVPYRVDQQQAGRRTVELRWWICESCRHVRLNSWRFADTYPSDPQLEVERVPRRQSSLSHASDEKESHEPASMRRE